MKRVLVDCHGPIAVGKHYKSAWEDTWVSFKTRPGRVHTYGPCLIGRYCLQRDLEMYERLVSEVPEDHWQKPLAEAKAILEATQHGYVREDLNEPRIPNLYTSAEFIDRAEAERLLTWYLAGLGVHNPKLVWKRPELVVVPW